MTIYVVVLEDRHIDDQISLYATEAKARKSVAAHQVGYVAEYGYRWNETKIPGWLLYVKTNCDDGPKIRIEVKELQ